MTLHSEMQLAQSIKREKELLSTIEKLNDELDEALNLLMMVSHKITPHMELWPTEEKLKEFFIRVNVEKSHG